MHGCDDDDDDDDDVAQAPMFNEIEATFDVDASAGRLTCVASGEPAPVIYWIQPSGKATRYPAPPAVDTQVRDLPFDLPTFLPLDAVCMRGRC